MVAGQCGKGCDKRLMTKTNRYKRIPAILLVVLLLCGCAATGETPATPAPAQPAPYTVASAQEGQRLYTKNGRLSLYVDEKNALFTVEDADGNVWGSVPEQYEQDPIARGDALKLLGSLIQIHYSDRLGNVNVLSSRKESVEKGTAAVLSIDGGVRMEFTFEKYGITVPVEILLRENGIEVSVVCRDILESVEGYKLLSVDVLPNFSAAQAQQEGFLLVPDGSGALISWKDNPGVNADYSQYVYGRDTAITQLERGSVTQQVRLPVFGMSHDGTGYTAVVTQSAARAKINASVAGKRNSYSNAYAELIYRDQDLVLVEKKNQTVRIVETSHTTLERQTVRYTLMTGACSYVEMAQLYRTYLLEESGVTITARQDQAPLVVELFGGVMAQQSVLGFPVEKVVPLTTFDDARQILTLLQQAGVEQLTVCLTQWQHDATGAAMQTELSPDAALGGMKGLKALLEQCNSDGVSAFLNINTNHMVKSTWSYGKKSESASSIRRDPVMQYPYSVNTGEAKVSAPIFCLKPSLVTGVAQKLAADAAALGNVGLATDTLGELLYSDFDREAVTRERTQMLWEQALDTLASANGSLLVYGGNAYALPGATLLTDVSLDSSEFLIESRSVPFYQIVLHGIIPMSTQPLNDESDIQTAFLQAVETGTCLKWRWIARNEQELVETDYNDLISCRYENWLETAAAQYAQAQQLLRDVAVCTITGHEWLTPAGDVVKTTWSNGTVVLVNYSQEAVQVSGVTVPAQSFMVTEETA